MQPGKARAHVQHLDQNKPRQHKAGPPPAEPAHQQKDRNDQRGIAKRPDEAFRSAQRIRIAQNPLRQLDNRIADTGNRDIRRNSKQRHGHQHQDQRPRALFGPGWVLGPGNQPKQHQ